MFHSGEKRDEAVRQITDRLSKVMQEANDNANKYLVLENQRCVGEVIAYTAALEALGANIKLMTTPKGDITYIESIEINNLEM